VSNLLKKSLLTFICIVIPIVMSLTGGIIGLMIGVDRKYNVHDFSPTIGFMIIGFEGIILGGLAGVVINLGVFSLRQWVLHKPSIVGLAINGSFAALLSCAAGVIFLILPHE
jgi:hypothetical protein